MTLSQFCLDSILIEENERSRIREMVSIIAGFEGESPKNCIPMVTFPCEPWESEVYFEEVYPTIASIRASRSDS